jgi:Flp pilus assembly protein TadG
MNKTIKPARPTIAKPSFLGRLRSDVAGNTLMLVAGAILPLTAMIGAGVDMSRLYLVKSKLQQACDAGALATRKKMSGSATLSSDAQTLGSTFFANNFPTGIFGTGSPTFTTALDADGQITANAGVRVPQTIMTVFGNSFTDLTVRCDAKLEVANTDVMFVLDVTGSMADCPDGTKCAGGAGSKIVLLREAVIKFYETLENASAETSQLRFGFVPYSTTVNVGDIISASSVVDTHTYQTAIANMTTKTFLATYGTPTKKDIEEIYQSGKSISQEDCTKYGLNQSFSGASNIGPYSFTGGINPVIRSGGPPPANSNTRRYNNDATDGVDRGYSGAADTSGTYQSCRRRYTDAPATYTTGFTLTDYTYKPLPFSVSGFKTGSTVTLSRSGPARNAGYPSDFALNGYSTVSKSYDLKELATLTTARSTNIDTRWNKCIEERNTVATEEVAFTGPTDKYNPDNMLDMQIDKVATDNASKWRPMWQEMSRLRDGTAEEIRGDLPDAYNLGSPCPAPAAKLATLTKAEVQTYVDKLIPTGNTYHDVGMAWGARLISQTGMFSSENMVGANGKPIDRNIVFMTDGQLCPNTSVYTSQGIERVLRRVIGTTGDPSISNCEGIATIRHNKRFLALCEAAKSGLNIKVFTVAFGTGKTTELTSCADVDQDYVADEGPALVQAFQDIAARIASLRLSK